jgi:molybdopterin adenylyltransferase
MFTAMPLILSQVDEEGCCLVVTTGGTGPAPRDVTPEATEAVCSRMLPGYGEQMRALGLRYVPTAVLSRQTAGALVTLWPTKHRTH